MAQLSDNRREPMFRDRSLNRGDIATDLAIPLLAEHGWAGLTLAGVAAQGNLRRQSVTQWFGSGVAFREQVALRYAHRWISLLSSQLIALHRADVTDEAAVARQLLPRDEDGIVFTRIWLAICEAARSDPSIVAAVTLAETEQHASVASWLPDAEPAVHLCVGALVTGLRANLCAPDPISLADAYAATEALSG